MKKWKAIIDTILPWGNTGTTLNNELHRKCLALLKKDKVLYNWIEKPEKILGKKC